MVNLDLEKGNAVETTAEPEILKPFLDAVPDYDAQNGIQTIEAMTLSWGKASLAALLINVWLIFLTNGFRSSILYGLTPYVTSDFQSHSLFTVIGIVSDAMTAAGRAEGFLLMVGSATLVFYTIGFSGIIYTVAVLPADVTSLKNRGIAFAFTSSPYMITAFAGSKAAESLLVDVKNWRWGFGAFAIIVPVVTLSLFILLKLQLRNAEKKGLIMEETRNKWTLQYACIFITATIPGVFLFAGGLTVFLLPFTLAKHAPNGWKTDYIIAMIIVGVVVLNKFLFDRSVIGACLIEMTYQTSYYCWNSYFSSFLQVVCNLSVAEAGYVNSTFQVVSGVLLFIVCYLIRRTGRIKWLFYVTVPIYTFDLGLMIYFRQPNVKVGFIVMCEIFISIGGSVFIRLEQLARLAAVDHQYVAAVLALLYVSGTVGGAIGNAISGTIWTNTFLSALQRELLVNALPDVMTIYSSLSAQLAYPVGSVERLAIQAAYGYGQARMLATGVGIFRLAFIWMFLIWNHDVSQKK
ncbi:MFS general substrate transporter [Bimuria novae-zelandiae CBS 107.79]|uniref:MFS general substrate transporter n=1 Tax=Bimuria novae-zelandiae CBS 107.79 TaxID=1447943 RepID=A0A6A5UQS1_9PLEO|nr:MFS general substrate transporter [Bimuria novae-zelandiae CBS 107.79]